MPLHLGDDVALGAEAVSRRRAENGQPLDTMLAEETGDLIIVRHRSLIGKHISEMILHLLAGGVKLVSSNRAWVPKNAGVRKDLTLV